MAVVMSGNVAVPLDKELNVGDIRELLVYSDSSLCYYSITYGDIAEKILSHDKDTGIKFISMEPLKQTAPSNKSDLEMLKKWNAALDSKAMSALFFTSGTSGKSKLPV